MSTFACCVALFTLVLEGQQPAAQASTASPVPAPSYISRTILPSNVRECLIALGDRIQKPGKERLTLTGTASDTHYAAAPARLIWEVPGRLRFDRGASGAAVLIFDNVSGLANAAGLSDSELGIVESLLNDSVEAFLYGFWQRGHAYRFLGGRFRTDNGRTPNYSGPWLDIYESVVSTSAPTTILAPTQKFFQLDSVSKLLVRATYIIVRNGQRIPVSTEYSAWNLNNGQATPGKIVRLESGVPVFTFNVITAVVGPAAQDGAFPGHL